MDSKGAIAEPLRDHPASHCTDRSRRASTSACPDEMPVAVRVSPRVDAAATTTSAYNGVECQGRQLEDRHGIGWISMLDPGAAVV